MTLDIEILLYLQELRNSLGGALDEIFNGISKVSVVVMPLFPAIIYWSTSTKWGKRFLGTIWTGEVVNGLIKLTVCAYRPWIRSDLIEPARDSKVAATGYSFPSGHSMCAAKRKTKEKGRFILVR
ncbi:MAG: phosphatase PAP2 family protein [Erysipelotrichaceae bacterium]|nr:phosphatase PAP2 family protein [Erysipelotrichaceae bacterium]